MSSIWKLGDIPETGCAVCRHVQLLGKVLADAIGIKVSLQRGRVEGKTKGGEVLGGPHAWLICHINNIPYICDATIDYQTVDKIRYLSDNKTFDLSFTKGKKLYSPDDMS